MMLLAVNFIFGVLFDRWGQLLFSFTFWTWFLTTFSVAVSYEAAQAVDKFGKLGLKRAKELDL